MRGMIYLDNNATTRIADEARQAMEAFQREFWANPSSAHRFGQAARQRLELAREQLAELLHTTPARLMFTSGGTESNNLAIAGTFGATGPTPQTTAALLTSRVEHAAVREPAQVAEAMGIAVAWVEVSTAGRVDVEDFKQKLLDLAENGRTILVSMQWVNNETGVIQPIETITQTVEDVRQQWREQNVRTRIVLHVDATQAVGKLPVDLASLPVDLLTLSAHKFHGPKGVGALYIRQGIRLRPQNIGGPQERQLRGGTENTTGIVGMGVAAQLAKEFLQDPSRIEHLAALRNRLEQGLLDVLPMAKVNSADVPRVWNTTNIGFEGLEAEAILLGLSEKEICVSAGAACSSGSLEPSPVLLAMQVPEPLAHGSIRFSLSRLTTDSEIDTALQTVPAVVQKLAAMMPKG